MGSAAAPGWASGEPGRRRDRRPSAGQDLLECAWPAGLEAAGEPFKSKSWLAAMTVLLDRVGASGDLSVIRRWGWSRFAVVRRELPRRGTSRWYSPIVRAVFDAAVDPAQAAVGVANQRPGALERTRFALADLAHARAEKVSSRPGWCRCSTTLA